MRGDEGRRAGGIDSQARALEPERVGDAPRRDAEHVARDAVGVALGRWFEGDRIGVVGGACADEDSGPALVERGRGQSRVLECLPDDLEEEALLGIHLRRFTRGDPEELRVEAVDRLGEEAGPARAPPRGRSSDPGPTLRERADRIAAFVKQAPQRFGAVCAAGEAAADPDDRDRLRECRLLRLEVSDLFFESADDDGRPLEGLITLCRFFGIVHSSASNSSSMRRVSSSSDMSSMSSMFSVSSVSSSGPSTASAGFDSGVISVQRWAASAETVG